MKPAISDAALECLTSVLGLSNSTVVSTRLALRLLVWTGICVGDGPCPYTDFTQNTHDCYPDNELGQRSTIYCTIQIHIYT
jgi:hypothetical protein